MKKHVLVMFIAFTLGVLLSSGGSVIACDKHARHKKVKRGKSTAKIVNTSRDRLLQGGQTRKFNEGRSEHSAQNVHPDGSAVGSQEKHHNVSSKAEEVTTGMNIPDLEVLDQDGRRINFYSDLVKGKTVAINFIFTTCTTICPPLGATFARLQKELTDRANSDVQLISISVDPVTDTPERLKAWRAKFKAGAGWTLVTGDKQTMDKLLNALAASAAKREDHSAIVIIGNDQIGRWTRTYGLARPSQLITLIDDVRTENSAAQTLVKGGSQ